MLDAMVEGARVGVPIPDTGSFLEDLAVYATLAAVVTTPEVEATARALAAPGEHDPALAEASRTFWRSHIGLARDIVDRAIARGEIPPATDPRLIIETLVAPIYFRLLVSGEELQDDLIGSVAEVVAAGAAAGPPKAAKRGGRKQKPQV